MRSIQTVGYYTFRPMSLRRIRARGGWKNAAAGQVWDTPLMSPWRRGRAMPNMWQYSGGSLEPVAMHFRPELVLLSAGFDIHYKDPLGGMKVTEEGFAALTRILMDIADKCCKGRLVASLEGGYDIGGLTESVKAVLQEMRDDTHVSDAEMDGMECAVVDRDPVVERVMKQLKPCWPVF